MADTDEVGNPLNSFENITTYNNYYEFSTDKQRVSWPFFMIVFSPELLTDRDEFYD